MLMTKISSILWGLDKGGLSKGNLGKRLYGSIKSKENKRKSISVNVSKS